MWTKWTKKVTHFALFNFCFHHSWCNCLCSYKIAQQVKLSGCYVNIWKANTKALHLLLIIDHQYIQFNLALSVWCCLSPVYEKLLTYLLKINIPQWINIMCIALHLPDQYMIYSVLILPVQRSECSIHIFLQFKTFITNNSISSSNHNPGFSWIWRILKRQYSP